MSNTGSSDESEVYDFILVGAGTAACLIANRLSQQLPDHKILLLEAGQHLPDDPKVLTPGLSVSLQDDPLYDWQYTSVPEPGLNGKRVQHTRGKLVGGTSAINSHSVVFPNHEWQDRIAEELLPQEGREEWTAEGMRKCYQRSQNLAPWASGGKEAWTYQDRIQVTYLPNPGLLQKMWARVFEEMGHPPKSSEFAKSSVGAVDITNAIDLISAKRSHAGTAFLEPVLQRSNVTLKTGVMVDRVVFDEMLSRNDRLRVKGVRCIVEGEEQIFRAKEVIVCAGTFGSPALLERAGIGRKEILQAANVPMLYELPGVGENLQDHLNCSLSREVNDNVPTKDSGLLDPEVRKAAMVEYEQKCQGRLSEGGAYSFAFTPLQMVETEAETQELVQTAKQAVCEETDPGLRAQYTVIKQAIEGLLEATATTLMVPIQRSRDLEVLPKDTPRFVDGNFITIIAMLAHPFSRGSCHISSSNPSQHPHIKFNYLAHPLDTEILGRHMRLNETIFQQPAFAEILKPGGKRIPRSYPHPILTVEDGKKILPINSATNYHPSSTCSMMREDLGGVVDNELRVYGTANVYVCDASVLPIIPRGNILTAVYAYAEKAAELIVKRHQATSA